MFHAPNAVAELARFVLGSGWVLFVPGIAILALVPPRYRPASGPGWVWAMGLGLALHPILYLYRHLFGITAGPSTASRVSMVFLLLLAATLLLRHRAGTLRLRPRRREVMTAAAIGLIAVATFALRWGPLQPQPVAPGSDSYRHAERAQAMVDSGDLLPEGVNYHYGFHATTAAISTTSGLPVHRTQLLMEALLLGLVAASMAVFATRLLGDWYSGLGTGLVVGFLGIFPAYYLIWGRMTMLQAVVLLPLILTELLPGDERRSVLRPVCWILTAGVMLTHYSIAGWVAFAGVTLVLMKMFAVPVVQPVAAEIKRLALALVPPLLLIAPWVYRILAGPSSTDPRVLAVEPGTRYPPKFYDLRNLEFLLHVRPTPLFLALGIAGAIVLARKPTPEKLFIPVWLLVTLPFVDPYRLALPGAGIVYETAYLSVAAIFLGVFAGHLIGLVAKVGRARLGAGAGPRMFAATAIVVALVGGSHTVDLLDSRPDQIYVRTADIEAFEWIKSNLPDDSRFMIGMVVIPKSGRPWPIDAGGWLHYFTGLENRFDDPELSAAQPALQSRIGARSTFERLHEVGVTHIYLGTRDYGLFNRSTLESSAYYEKIYAQAGTAVYRLVEL